MLEEFSNAKVLVIGDIMLDRYWWGTVNRISPEAPVPVVSLDSTTVTAGGAANVAANIVGLGATPFLVGICGDDEEAGVLPTIMADAGISQFRFFPIEGRKTTTKNRVVAHNQQMLRLDHETSAEISPLVADRIFDEIKSLIVQHDIVLVSDYAKGFLTADLVKNLIAYTTRMGKKIVVDPKGRDYTRYRGSTILTPNQREASDACALGYDCPVAQAGDKLMADLSLDALLVTQGELGMTLFEKAVPAIRIDAIPRNVYNVTGAGDTAIATVAVALAAGTSFSEAAEYANLAAGLVVESVGTTAITREMLIAEAARSE